MKSESGGLLAGQGLDACPLPVLFGNLSELAPFSRRPIPHLPTAPCPFFFHTDSDPRATCSTLTPLLAQIFTQFFSRCGRSFWTLTDLSSPRISPTFRSFQQTNPPSTPTQFPRLHPRQFSDHSCSIPRKTSPGILRTYSIKSDTIQDD